MRSLKWHLSILPFDAIVFLFAMLGSAVFVPAIRSDLIAFPFAGLNHAIFNMNRDWVESDRMKAKEGKS